MIDSKVYRKAGFIAVSFASVALVLSSCSTADTEPTDNNTVPVVESDDNSSPTIVRADEQDTTDDIQTTAPAEDVTTDGVDDVELDDYGNPISENEDMGPDGVEQKPVALEDRPLNGVEIPHEMDPVSKNNWKDVNVESNGGGHFMLVTEGMNQPFTMTIENGVTGEKLYYRKAQGRYTPYFAMPNAQGYEHIRVFGEVNEIPYDVNLRIQETYHAPAQVMSYGQVYVETDTKGNIKLELHDINGNVMPIENKA